jgi:hypothetical protein
LTQQLKTNTMKVNVPQVLRQVKNYKSVAEKVMFLYCISNHPLHPHIMNGITKCVSLSCDGRIDDKTMIDYIDEMCELFADKFNSVKKPQL